MVARLQNRTLINIPLSLLDAPFGVFGVGTFGEEGCRVPSSDELSTTWWAWPARSPWRRAASAGKRARRSPTGSAPLLERAARAGAEAREPRPARGRHRARLQQPAHGHHRERERWRRAAARTTRSRPRSSRCCEAAERAAALTRQLLAVSRAQGLSLKPLDMNERAAPACWMMLRRILPENDRRRSASMAAPCRWWRATLAARAGVHEPAHQRARRDAGGRQGHDRDGAGAGQRSLRRDAPVGQTRAATCSSR